MFCKIMIIMRIKYIIIGLLIILQGCGHLFDKCGDNVLMGEFMVMPESIADWHPDWTSDQLVFTNSENEELILQQAVDTSFMEVQSGKVLCWEESWDTSSEYVRTEWVVSRYEGNGHELEIQFHVGWHVMNTNFELDELFDHVSYYSHGEHMGGTLDLVANDRGNNIDPDILSYPSYVFADTLEINGQQFENVWYFNREDPSTVFTPSLYVKEGVGILGFLDDDGTTWLLEQ